MSCNFALGHHGYCPHGSLTYVGPVGRPESAGSWTAAQREQRRDAHISFKLSVFAAYGGCLCACCGETNHECLQIDHIENNGAAHRKEINGSARDGRNFYYWLKRNNFPPGYRVLCVNCNFSYGHFGLCPHQQAQV